MSTPLPQLDQGRDKEKQLYKLTNELRRFAYVPPGVSWTVANVAIPEFMCVGRDTSVIGNGQPTDNLLLARADGDVYAVGVLAQAVAQGELGKTVHKGIVIGAVSGRTAGDPVWVGLDGSLVFAAPVGGYVQQIAVCVNATDIYVDAFLSSAILGLDALFWLSTPNAFVPNGVDMGALNTGVLQQVVTLGVSTPSTFPGTPRSVLFIGPTGLLDEDATQFRWWSNVHRLGIGLGATTPLKQVHVHDAVNGGTAIIVSNGDPGASAISGLFAIRSPATVNDFSVGPYMTGGGFAGAGGLIIAGDGVLEHTNKTETTDLVFSRFGPGGFRWIATTTTPPVDGSRATRMYLSDVGELFLATSLGAGGYVTADVTTGRLVIGAAPVPLSTTVQGTAPIAIAGDHAAHDLSVNRVWSLDTNGVTDTFIRQGAATSVIGRSANSVGNVADITSTVDGDVLWRSTGSLIWSHIPVTSVSGAVPDSRVLSGTSPIRIDGGAFGSLAADRTISHADTAVTPGSYTAAGITVDAMGHITAASNGVWPTAAQVLFSSGTATMPIGEAGFTFIAADNLLAIGAGYAQGWFNLGNDGSGTFEEVAAFWSGNVFNLKSVTSGGTVRDMRLDADTANIFVAGAVASMYGASSSNRITTSGTLGAEVGASITRASSASMVLDAIQLTNPSDFSITGVTHITTATGVNFVTVERPVYDGGGNAKTIDIGATVYIANAPLDQNGVTLTAPLALWVDNGTTRLDGRVDCGGLVTVNGGTPAANDMFICAPNNDNTRDHVKFYVGGAGGTYDIPNNDWFLINPINTAVNFYTTGILTTVRINSLTYTGSSDTITAAVSLYVANEPTLVSITGDSYAIWVDAGKARFDGDGTHVFELPADATGNVSLATGRVPVRIGGATKYIRYYDD